MRASVLDDHGHFGCDEPARRARRRESGLINGRILALLAVVASLFVTLESSAQRWNQRPFGRAGGYVSIGGGGATDAVQLEPFRIDNGSAFTIGGRLGYRANPFLAMEGTVDYTASGFEARFDTAQGPSEVDTRTVISTGNVKLYPGGWRFSPFVMGGAGLVHAMRECSVSGVDVGCSDLSLQETDTEFAGRVGAGVDFYLTRNIAITGEIAYVMPTGTLDDLRIVTYGGQLLVRF